MMHLAPLLGRNEAHDVVYDLSAEARSTGTSLPEAARAFLSERGLPEADLSPTDYLGEAEAVVDVAIERWRNTLRPVVTAP